MQRFYSSWIAAAGESLIAPVEQGLHNNSTYLTNGFRGSILRAAKKTEDAVLCGINSTEILIDHVRVYSNGTHATVLARLNDHVIRILLLRNERDFWRIDEVECPRTTITID